MSTLLNRSELAALFGCSKATIRRYEREGKLRPIRLSPRVVRFKKEDVEKLVNTTAEVKA